MKKICKMSKKDLDTKRRYDELNDFKLGSQMICEGYVNRLNRISDKISDEMNEVTVNIEEMQSLLNDKKDLLENFETKKHSMIYRVSKKNREMIDDNITKLTAEIHDLNELLETKLLIEHHERRRNDLDKQMEELKQSLANEEVINLKQIISKLEHNAWYGGDGNTTLYLKCGDDIAMVNAYTYELGYESYSTASSLTLNDECLFELNSRNVDAYRYKCYTSGKFNTIDEAINYIETKFDGKDVCITDVRPQQQMQITDRSDTHSSLYADDFVGYDEEDEEVEEMQEEPEF